MPYLDLPNLLKPWKSIVGRWLVKYQPDRIERDRKNKLNPYIHCHCTLRKLQR